MTTTELPNAVNMEWAAAFKASDIDTLKGKAMRSRRRVSTVLMSLVLAFTGLVATAPAVAAAPNYMYKNVQTRLCLDDFNDVFGSVRTRSCTGADSMRWYHAWAPTPGALIFKNKSTGECLGDTRRATIEGLVFHALCGTLNNISTSQQWYIRKHAGVGYYFENVFTHRCLDSNQSGRVYSLPCGGVGNRNQHWVR